MRFALGLVLVLLSGCGLKTAELQSMEIVAKDGGELQAEGRLGFALVGATHGGNSEALITDVRTQIAVDDLSFVALTGGLVGGSSTAAWKGFASRWGDIVKGTQVSDNKARRPVLPLVGSGERVGDPDLKGLGHVFPGIGADVGYARVAPWTHFDVRSGQTRWRFVFIDSQKKRVGARWAEQTRWLREVLSGPHDRMLVFMSSPLVTLTASGRYDPGGGARELLTIVEEDGEDLKRPVVFFAGAATNEVFMPSGNFGTAFVNIGGSNKSTTGFYRSSSGGEDVPAGYAAGFDALLIKELRAEVEAQPLDDEVLDRAQGSGEWTGERGYIASKHLPLSGWWEIFVQDDQMLMQFRMSKYAASFSTAYQAKHTKTDGWREK